MNANFSSQHRDPNIKLNSQDPIQEEIYTYEPEMNTAEGSEFLDDGIRTKDQPFEDGTDWENEPSAMKNE